MAGACPLGGGILGLMLGWTLTWGVGWRACCGLLGDAVRPGLCVLLQLLLRPRRHRTWCVWEQ